MQLIPAIGDIGSGIGADGVEAPLAQRELAVEAIDQVQAEADDGHHAADAEDGCVQKSFRTPMLIRTCTDDEDQDERAAEEAPGSAIAG